MPASSLTASLNAAQRSAVCATPQPILVLAGAGSGKTRVITHRIAWLIDQKLARGHDILAMTFTNRAAREMRDRVDELLGGASAYGPLITTFHSACARWLRTHARQVGLQPNFSIYDADDSRNLVKQCAKSMAMPYDASAIRQYVRKIEQAHHLGDDVRAIETQARTQKEEEFADLFAAYHAALTQACAVDFGTLITSMLHLLERNDRVRAAFQERYRHVLVDEFQDTNTSQYRLMRALTGHDSSIMVVGDDDQSIYGWRGAEVENIQRFVRDYHDVQIVKLEQNYRSISPILNAAHALVERLPDRMDKKLRATRQGERAPEIFVANNDREEAEFVAKTIERLHQEEQISYGDMAVFYRTNAQSRAFELRLQTAGIPFQIVGYVGYFERREIRDLMAWLRLVANPADDAAMDRVRSTPPRGIGQVTWGRLLSFREEFPDWLQTLAAWPQHEDAKRSRKSLAGIADLLQLLEDLSLEKEHLSVAQILESILERTQYLTWLQNTESDSFEDRARNVEELLHLARQTQEEDEDASLEHFLETIALTSSGDRVQGDEAVQLMTIHTAKGLEFPIVFLTGLEEGIFPLVRRYQEDDTTSDAAEGDSLHDQEERRLAYVAITRAKDHIYLSAAQHRQRFGHTLMSRPSLFLEELVAQAHVHFEPQSVMQSLEWSGRTTRGDNGFSREKARSASQDDFFDQRPWEEREEAFDSMDMIPDDGVIFDDRYYPDDSVEAAQQWIGKKARHKLFGIGAIVDADPTGGKVRLTIEFPTVGTKKVIADYVEIL